MATPSFQAAHPSAMSTDAKPCRLRLETAAAPTASQTRTLPPNDLCDLGESDRRDERDALAIPSFQAAQPSAMPTDAQLGTAATPTASQARTLPPNDLCDLGESDRRDERDTMATPSFQAAQPSAMSTDAKPCRLQIGKAAGSGKERTTCAPLPHPSVPPVEGVRRCRAASAKCSHRSCADGSLLHTASSPSSYSSGVGRITAPSTEGSITLGPNLWLTV